MKTLWIAVCAAVLTPLPSSAQHEHARSGHADGQSVEVTSLTEVEVRELREGEGMGMARAAELNGYPGPKHALELATELGLSPDQTTAIGTVRAEMLAAAIALGEQVLGAERRLAAPFAAGSADDRAVRRLASDLAGLRAELQTVHLLAHLRTRELLSPAQIERYDELRGYRAPR